MKKLLLLALLPLSSHAIEQDKFLHFGVSGAVAGVTMYHTQDWRIAMSVCMAVGLAKELYDEHDYGGFDTQDLAADALGCVTGTLLVDYGLKVEANSDEVGIQWNWRF